MPSRAPHVSDRVAARLQRLGARVRAQRRAQKVSAALTAEAAGMSRSTLNRIEGGEPSVTMGAYLSAIAALGLELEFREREAPPTPTATGGTLPARLRLDDFPELKRLSWQRPGALDISPAEALSLYERNWRHVDPLRLEPAERALLQFLAVEFGGGRLLV